MLTVTDLEKLISNLPPSQLAEFRQWFARFDTDQWDKQFADDAASGKLDRLAGQALDDLKAGRCKDL